MSRDRSSFQAGAAPGNRGSAEVYSYIQIIAVLLGVSLLSVICAIWWSRTNQYAWDDAGFELKYIENFAHGCLFCFNMADGPVFGLSGFVHGVLSGVFAYTGAFSPREALLASNTIGVALTLSALSLTFFLIDRRAYAVLLFTAATISCAPSFVGDAYQLMETPLHGGLLLLTMYLLLTGKRKAFYLFSAIDIMSKLDATLTVASWILLEALCSEDPHIFNYTRFRQFVVWFLVPLLLWIGCITILFGSPLPLSFQTKLLNQKHPDITSFPFLKRFLFDSSSLPLSVWSVITLLGIPLVSSSRLKQRWLLFAPGVGWLAYIVAFSIFNPREIMGWYIAVPQLLYALQPGVILAVAWARLESQPAARYAIVVLLFGIIWCEGWSTYFKVRGQIAWVDVAEGTRVEAGAFIKAAAAKNETVLTPYGNIGYESGLRMYDLSGLNSRNISALGLVDNDCEAAAKLKVDWIAGSGQLCDTLMSDGFRLIRQFYDISTDTGGHFASIKIYRRTGDHSNVHYERLILPENEKSPAGEIYAPAGTSVTLKNVFPRAVSGLRFGIPAIECHDKMRVLLLAANGSKLENLEVPCAELLEERSVITVPVVFNFTPPAPVAEFVITTGNGQFFEALEPMIEIDPNQPR